MNIKPLNIAFSLLFTASNACSLSDFEKKELDALSYSSGPCYYFAETNLDRVIFYNIRSSLSYLISNIVSASCCTAGGTRTNILNQFNEAAYADGRFGVAKFARVVFGPFQTRNDGLLAHRRHITNYLSNNHVVTDFSFRYYRQDSQE